MDNRLESFQIILDYENAEVRMENKTNSLTFSVVADSLNNNIVTLYCKDYVGKQALIDLNYNELDNIYEVDIMGVSDKDGKFFVIRHLTTDYKPE